MSAQSRFGHDDEAMEWSISAVRDAVRAPSTGVGPVDRTMLVEPVSINAVTIDSRTCGPGSLFVALRADRDGHEFVSAARAAGALCFIVDEAAFAAGTIDGASSDDLIVVDDTFIALQQLGAAARNRLNCPVIGITGSVGKTTTKDMLAAIGNVDHIVSASERSFNNEFGVPLTLANARTGTELAVIEMGARGIGHIRSLCPMVRPTIAVVTAVAAAHTEFFGDLEAVAIGKGELVECLDPSGVAVLNGDDQRVTGMRTRTTASVLMAGAGRELRAESIELDDGLFCRFEMFTPWGSVPVRLAMAGRHHVMNALLAAGAALSAGATLDAVASGLAVASGSPGRMQLHRTATGATIIDDSYNANPASMEAGLRALAEVPARRRLAVVGVMAELGEDAADEHRSIARLARELGIELIVVGTDLYGVGPVDDVRRATGSLDASSAVLIKGSRVAGTERFVEELLAEK